MAAPTRPVGAALLGLMMLAACSSPPTGTAVPEVPAAQTVATPASPAQAAPAASPPAAQSAAQIDPGRLPEDVRDFILRQRMCRHFSRPEPEGGNPAMAKALCADADESAWKALVRKYQGDDGVASVLLAERPPAGATK